MDQSIVAGLHQAGMSWRAVVARRENGSLRLIDSREFAPAEMAEIEPWLMRLQAWRVIVVLPASSVICRTAALPDASMEELRSALALQAETHMEGTAPPHRQAMAVLHASPGEATRTGLILAWPQRAQPPAIPFAHYVPSYTADVACLAALLNGARSNEPLLWIDRREGSIALALGHAQGVVFRAASEQGDDPAAWRNAVQRLVAETALAAGHTDQFIDEVIESIRGAIASSSEAAQLLLPEEAFASGSRRLRGEKAVRGWWNRFAVPAGAVLATLDQLDPLTQLRALAPLAAPSGVERLITRLSQRRVAAALLIAALVVVALGPLAFAGARLLILRWKVGEDLTSFQAAQHQREARVLMYEELARRTWPMAKLLADIANSAPEGITVDTIRLDETGNEVDVRGTADAPQTVNEFTNTLSTNGVFGDVEPSYSERDQSSGNLSFSLRAQVANAFARARYEDDFAEEPLAVRMYGERARPGGPRVAQANPDQSNRQAANGEAELDESGETIEESGEGDEFGRTGPRSSRAPVRLPSEARDGAAPPEMPPLLTREEIDALPSSEVQTQLLKVVTARNNKSQYTAEQIQQIDEQYEMLMTRLRAGRGGGS
jgi:hypothetical protein